jgi:streptogramin lyase/cytochrome c5
MKGQRVIAILATVAFAMTLTVAISIGWSAAAETSRTPGTDTTNDDLQRSYKIDHYTEVADSGPRRGENIYAHKCWVCHNKYQTVAPHLSTLVNGSPVNEEAVTAQIKNGGAGMPSFRTTLSDSDVADVVSYLRGGQCCLEGEDLPANPWYRASAQKWTVPTSLSGGPTGVVRIASGDPPQGIMVQLIAPNGVRSTVYTNDDGNFEFPRMQSGPYTLRIATPLEFKPYRRDSVAIVGATKLDDIVLERISKTLALPATPEVESQLSGEELLWNLPGTVEEKEAFHATCGSGCHSFQQIFKNHYDERSWRVLVKRMLHRGGGPIIVPPEEVSSEALAEDELVIKWLAKVRGPDSKDGPLWLFPRLTGASNRVVVTEYELPRVVTSVHDVYGDANGNIWYTSHLSRNLGRLDPHTGIVTEYQTPLTPGAPPGTHHVMVEKDGTVLFSENWSHKLLKFDPRTEQFTELSIKFFAGDFGLAPDGSIWDSKDFHVRKIDPQTGRVLQSFPLKIPESYGRLISNDGNFWAGGAPAGTKGNSAELLDIRNGEMLNLDSGGRPSAAKRGGFDPAGNAWFAGENGTLVELDAKAKRIREYWPPTPYDPYTDFYSAMPDKNGEVWTEELHGRKFLRFNPRTERWTQYAMPEPYAHARWTWVDNSTNPVTVWYADYSAGRVVRIQPLE